MENQSAQTNPPAVGSSLNSPPNPVNTNPVQVAGVPVINSATILNPVNNPVQVASPVVPVTSSVISTPVTPVAKVAASFVGAPTSTPVNQPLVNPVTIAVPAPVSTVSSGVIASGPKITPPSNSGAPIATISPTSNSTGTISASQTAAVQNSATKVSDHTSKVKYPWYQFYKSSEGVQKALMIAVISVGFVIFAYAGYFVGKAVGLASVVASPEVRYSDKSETSVSPTPTTVMAPVVVESSDSAKVNTATVSGKLEDKISTSAANLNSSGSAIPVNQPAMR